MADTAVESHFCAQNAQKSGTRLDLIPRNPMFHDFSEDSTPEVM